jgi:hypothetical protein
MNWARDLGEILRLRTGLLREEILSFDATRKIYKYGPHARSFAGLPRPGEGASEIRPGRAVRSGAVPARAGKVNAEERSITNDTRGLIRALAGLFIPNLGRIKVNLQLERLSFVEALPSAKVAAESKPTPPRASVETVPETRPVVERAPEVSVKVPPPTAKRKGPRLPKVDVQPAVSEPLKPLKVIRRRGEEAPKVFVTPPKSVPEAMMEGVGAASEEER